MAALSTLRLYKAETVRDGSQAQKGHNQPSPQLEADSLPYSTTPEIETPSLLHTDNVPLTIGTLFGNDRFGQDTLVLGSVSDVWQRYNRVEAPTDGEKAWYCSECGDGPYGMWQPACQSCQHSKCGSCSVEEK